MSHYGFSVSLPDTYDKAVTRVTQGLAAEGFGVLTEIDVQATLKKKLNADFRRYVILGACNPPLAHKALSSETEIGLLLPCNVIVYENEDGGSTVSLLNPMQAMSIVDNPQLLGVAAEVSARLQRVAAALRAP